MPYSWSGTKVYVENYDAFLRLKQRGNAVFLSTHCSRIDWLIGVYLCALDWPDTARVGFVAEATTALMPVIGWSRMLFGDIVITRAFHKDGTRAGEARGGEH